MRKLEGGGRAPETVKERGNRRDSQGELERQRRRERGSTTGGLWGAREQETRPRGREEARLRNRETEGVQETEKEI